MESDILDWSATRIAYEIADGHVSAVEVTNTFLKRIEALNPVVNAVCTLNENALAEAEAVDKHHASRKSARHLALWVDLIKVIRSFVH